jgi:hypothetical protein
MRQVDSSEDFDEDTDIDPIEKCVKDMLMAVVELQQFDGCWTDVEGLCAIIGRRIAILDELMSIREKERERVFATIIAIAILRDRCATQRASWQLIEQKGLNWLLPSISAVTVDIEALINRTIAQFHE